MADGVLFSRLRALLHWVTEVALGHPGLLSLGHRNCPGTPEVNSPAPPPPSALMVCCHTVCCLAIASNVAPGRSLRLSSIPTERTQQ
jgi:hypothetical protein